MDVATAQALEAGFSQDEVAAVHELVKAAAVRGVRFSAAVLSVVGPEAGRRRAGRAFGKEASHIPLDDLGERDLVAIATDPQLRCEIVAGDGDA